MADSVHPVRRWRLSQVPAVTLDDLAERAKTTGATISRIETGVHEPRPPLARRLARICGITMDALFGDQAGVEQ